MILRKMTPSDRTQAATMWRLIFEDSEAFTDWYFAERFRPEHSFGAFDGGRMIAMTIGRATQIRVEGRTHHALLISGVSTLPEYRGRRLMHRLVQMQTDHARDAGFVCCYLHPVAESLYTSLGFENGTDILSVRSDASRTHNAFTLKEGNLWGDLLTVYNSLTETHDGMQLRDEHEIKLVFADYSMDHGQTLIAYAENRPKGYICYSADGTVFELIARCTHAYEILLDEAAKRVGKELKAAAPIDCGVEGERLYSMQYLVFDNAFKLPLQNGFCQGLY